MNCERCIRWLDPITPFIICRKRNNNEVLFVESSGNHRVDVQIYNNDGNKNERSLNRGRTFDSG